MNKTFEQGRDEVAALCAYFAKNRASFTAAGCKEAHVRQDLIDPLFRALGWDVGNAARHAPHLVEVKVEDSLEVEGQNKAPDYAFRVGEQVRFYVEAKKCGVNIASDPAPAYQLRRYGWSAKIALSILTDFEELAVYDCTQRPRPSDKAGKARTHLFRYEEYHDRWRELWDVFSREAVWSGGFDQYAAAKRKRGTSEVDNEFLKEIEGWREKLARNIALRNNLGGEDLNRAVQVTIDRVVFLRMAEDRGLEPEYQLLKLADSTNCYARFVRDLCRKADEKYNSGLFHFQKDADVAEPPDTLTTKLLVDDKVFKPILQSLYFEHGSPYHFGVLPVDILGTVYERFLGKVIRLTPGGQAKVEEKPEVRKAGGVYYTPAYIVNYIVRQTVGRQIEGKSPRQLAGRGKAEPLRVLDMACGSGSFLLGAYQCLLDHYLKWYIDHTPGKHAPAVSQNKAGEWALSISEKKRILTTHIFGVDIDPQAVEVSKLSLLLKVLKGESAETIGDTMRLFHERALPNLSDNIKCGNSLIGPDYFAGRLIEDAEEFARVNAFDWKRQFPAAFAAKSGGGFDCVIGNPPYIRIQTMKETAPLEVEIYKELFKTARQGNYDIYVVFVEQGLKMLNRKGRLGFILPHKFFNAEYGEPLRSLVAEGKHLAHVVHFGDQQVFDGATTYTCLLFLDKSPVKECDFVKVEELIEWQTGNSWKRHRVSSHDVSAVEWNFSVGPERDILERMVAKSVSLSAITRIFVGLQTDADDVFILEQVAIKGNRVLCRSKATDSEYWFENHHLKQFLKGSLNIRRYHLTDVTKRLIFPYQMRAGKSVLIDRKEYEQSFPLTWAYLQANRSLLSKRNKGRMGQDWYGYVYRKNHTRFTLPKLLVPSLATGSCFAADLAGEYYFVGSGGGGGGGYALVVAKDSELSPQYLLGVLNSTLLSMAIKSTSTPFRGGYLALNRQYIEKLPIRTIDFSNKAEKGAHDRIVKLVEAMLALHKQRAATQSPGQQTAIDRQIEATDAEIDRLVYQLYGLSDEEIAIVEGAAGR